MTMNFHLTDQRKKKINSVQSIPMKHCAEYSVYTTHLDFIGKPSKGILYPFLGSGFPCSYNVYEAMDNVLSMAFCF